MSTKTTTISLTQNWEELRKRARQLENEIDSKLVSLNKLGISLGGTHARFDVNYASSSGVEKTPLLSSQTTFESLSAELESLLAKLNEINDQMTDFVHGSASGSGFSQNPALQHTLRRHRDILRDYSNEFNRTHTNIQTQLDRQELLGSTDADSLQNGLNNRGRTDMYLKENEHLRSTERMIDDQISIAISAKEHMQSQRMNLRDISKKINTITKRYPAINSVMQKIQFKKRKDTIVLAGVISACLILLFIYMMHS